MQYDFVSVVAARRGIPALRRLLSELPGGFGTPIVCLVEALPRLAGDLQAFTRLKVKWAEPGVSLEPGCVYLSSPGTSLVCRPDGTLSVTPFGLDSTALNPVDQYLSSSAACHGPRLLALVLAGLDQDGVSGAADVNRLGGTLAILDRATAEYWGMAEAIVRAGTFDRVLAIGEVAAALRACFTSQDLLRCAEIQIRLGMLLESALRASGTDRGHIARHLPSAGHLRIVAERGVDIAFIEALDPIVPDEGTACGRALLTRARAVIPDVLADERCAPHRATALAFGIRAEHATPLLGAGSGPVRGTLTALYRQPHEVSPEEARAVDRVASQAASILEAFPARA